MNWINIPDNIEDYLGFVYVVTNLQNNKKYIGKKVFWNKIRRKPLKGKKRVRLDKKESDWKDYYGSSNKLLSDVEKYGKDNFKREIIILCKSKFELSYFELLEQIKNNVLLDDNYYNEIINIRLKAPKYK
jgi:hypothetical protein